MRKMKKLVGILLTLIMSLGLVTTAFAADLGTGSGSITIKNATEGKLYNIYKIFDTDSTGTGNITATEAQKTFYEAQNGNVFVFTPNASGTYNVSVKTDTTTNTAYTDDQVIAFLQSFVTADTSGNVTVDNDFANVTDTKSATATDATLIFSDIPYGYYLVTSSLGAVITVDSTATNLTVIDKNQAGPSWDEDGGKTVVGSTIEGITDQTTGDVVRSTSANFGDVLNFQISVDTTNYDGDDKITNYYIDDALAKGMAYVMTEGTDPKIDATVKVGNTEITGYTLTYNENNNSFQIVIPWLDENGEHLYTSPGNITVTYSATVLDTAEIAGAGNDNTATFNYTINEETTPDPTRESHEEIVRTYTYALAINKMDPTGNGLAGATFNLTDSNNSVIKVTAITDQPGIYKYDVTSSSNEVVSPAVGTDGSSVIIIKGVAAGTYKLTETKAPDGYNLLTEAVDVATSIAETSQYTKTITIYKDADGNVVKEQAVDGSEETITTDVNVKYVNVVNEKGSELPSTGGMGTTILYIIGAILVIGAAVLLIVRRRMNGER